MLSHMAFDRNGVNSSITTHHRKRDDLLQRFKIVVCLILSFRLNVSGLETEEILKQIRRVWRNLRWSWSHKVDNLLMNIIPVSIFYKKMIQKRELWEEKTSKR
jgi:hypothetical protein